MAEILRNSWWCRETMMQQDWCIINDVYTNDCYRVQEIALVGDNPVIVDVGACLGAFSRKAKERWATAKIVAVEANENNISVLTRNVGKYATVIHAAMTYEPDPAMLDTVFEGTLATGGSIVLPRKAVEESTDDRYRRHLDVLPTVTLEQTMERVGVDHIDLLKMDCEGSEYGILENAGCLDKVRAFVGEYHGGEERFRGTVARHLPKRTLRVWSQHDHMGLFLIT